MTDDLEDSSQWRDSVESRLGTLETAAAEQKAALKDQADLRATMDEELGTLGAKVGLIKALSKTQSEHTALLRDHTARLSDLKAGQEDMRTKLDLVHLGVESIHTLLLGLTAIEPDEDNVGAKPVDGAPGA